MRSLLAFVVALALLGSARPVLAQETPDEQYQFIAGLCEQRHFELAVTQAREFVARNPGHAKVELARYRLATALYELGRYDEAQREYASLSKRERFEFAAEVAFRLGQCELAVDRPQAAAAAFQRVRAMKVDYLAAPATFYAGEALFRSGDFTAAERAYEAVSTNADYARDAAHGLAWCAFRLARHDLAAQRSADFLARFPRDAAAGEMSFLLGEARLASGQAQAALEAYGQVESGEWLEPALRGAAFASAALDDHAAAAARFGALLKRFPKGQHAAEAALHRGIELVRAGDSAAALEALRSPLVAASADAHYWRAQAELASGDASAALASLDAALAAGPSDELAERVHLSRGDALSALGRSDDAAGAYARSGSEHGLYGAAIAAHNAGRRDDAARLAQRLIAQHPRSRYAVEMQLVIGEAAFGSQRYEAAEQAFLAAREQADGTAGPLLARATSRWAWCRFLQDDFGGAAQGFRAVVEHFGAAAEADEAHYMLGLCAEKSGDARAAMAAWSEYVERRPSGARRADALLGLSRVDAANEGWLDTLARENPGSAAAATASFELAERLARSGDRSGAAARYRDVLARFPEHEIAPAARYGLAWCAYEDARFDEAARELAALRADARLQPELKLAVLELSVWTASKAGDIEATEAVYRELAQTSLADARKLAAARIAAKALAGAGHADRAQALYDELLRRARDRGVARAILIESAWLALDAGQPDAAEAALRTAIKFGLDDATKAQSAEVGFFVGEARFEAGDDARAVELYRLASEQGTPDVAARALYKRGFAELRRGDLAAAAECFARLVDEHAEHELHGEGLYLLGETHCRAGRWDQAVPPLERLKRELPKHASLDMAAFRLGVAYGELGRWEECEQSLAEFLRRKSGSEQAAEAELWRARAQARRGDARAARASLERLIARDRTVIAARARIELGQLSTAAGDHEQALTEFLKVALLFANEAEVSQALYLAGNALEELGRADQARERYREIVERHARSQFAERARERLDHLGNG